MSKMFIGVKTDTYGMFSVCIRMLVGNNFRATLKKFEWPFIFFWLMVGI